MEDAARSRTKDVFVGKQEIIRLLSKSPSFRSNGAASAINGPPFNVLRRYPAREESKGPMSNLGLYAGAKTAEQQIFCGGWEPFPVACVYFLLAV